MPHSGWSMLYVRCGTNRIEYKGYLANAIQLDETALNSARDKMLLQEHQTTSMADMLVSLANHYDQVAKVLTEEIGVQEQQYSTAYREAITFFKKIEAFEPELAQLVQIFKVSETLNEDFEVTEKLTDEIISLAIWYEEFHNSYGALTVEIVRRHKAHESRQRLVKEFIDKMEASYADDMHSRGEFSDLHGKYLPVDLCPAFADLPVQYEVVSHGEWLLPMPTRATLKLVEEIEKAATK
ncbi:autophagy protein 17 [Entomortierella beljakovae]|nr:autophagy protein 17 [Entomortierella beljakovae]